MRITNMVKRLLCLFKKSPDSHDRRCREAEATRSDAVTRIVARAEKKRRESIPHVANGTH